MKICLVSDDRLVRTRDDVHWSSTGYDWREFADLFGPELERIHVLARVQDRSVAPEGWAPVEVDDRARVVALPWFEKYRVFLTIPGATRRLRKEVRGADLVWLIVPNVYPTLAYAIARAARKPVLAWCVGDVSETALLVYDELPMRLAHRLYSRVTRAIVRRADVGVVASRTLERKYRGRRPLIVAYRAFGDPAYLAMERPRRDARTILYLGRLSPEKGAATLLEAFERVAEKLPDARLVIAGDGVQRAELAGRAARIGDGRAVDLAGWVPHGPALKDLLARADLMCLPSYTEGLPSSLLEALSAGLPVVGTEVGDIPAVVGAHGAGLTVPARDPDALAGALLEVMTDRAAYDRMADAAVATARDLSFEQETGRVVHAALQVVRERRGVRT